MEKTKTCTKPKSTLKFWAQPMRCQTSVNSDWRESTRLQRGALNAASEVCAAHPDIFSREMSVCMSTGTSKSCGEHGPPLQRAPVSGSQPCHMAASVMRACVNGRFTSLMTNFQGSGLCRSWEGTFRVSLREHTRSPKPKATWAPSLQVHGSLTGS